ncbi:MAG: MFS transporter [Nitrolancea sp.]
MNVFGTGRRSGNVLLVACVFFCLAATVNTQTFGLLLARVADTTGLSIAAMGGLRTLENVATIIVAIALAPHVDRYPRRLPLLVGFACGILGAITLWAFPSTLGAAAYFLLNGTAVMLIISTALAIPADFLTGRDLNRAMGFMIAGFALSEILFLPLAGQVAETYGWRASYLLTSTLLVIALLVALLVLPASNPVGADDTVSGGDYRRFVSNRRLLALLLSAMFRFAQYGAITTFLSTLLILRFGLRVSSIGGIFALVGIMSFSGSAMSGFVLHSGRFRLALIGGGTAVAVLTFTSVTLNPGLIATIVLILLVMYALALQENASTLAVLEMSREARGAATALNELSAASGALIGIGLGSVGLDLAGIRGLGITLTALGLLGALITRVALRNETVNESDMLSTS